MKTVYQPTVPYNIGVTLWQWVDKNREEIYTADRDDKHMVSVWIWYPADTEVDAESAPCVVESDPRFGQS